MIWKIMSKEENKMKQVRKSLSKIVAVMLTAAMLIQPYGVQETKVKILKT